MRTRERRTMIRRDSAPCLSRPAARVMKLQYGLNEADSWWYFAHGPARERLWARIRELRPRIIRIFAFDKGTPDPVEHWATFASYIQAVLEVGATPMITFASFREPHDDARAVRRFATRCADIVWGCIEQWGGEAVRDWYWCVWNEPNSTWIGGGMSFECYRAIYEEVAHGVRRWLDPYLADRPALIGGPSVEGFDPFWLDWIWRFVNEIDPSLVGFVNWHRYADWRDHGEKGAPQDGGVHRALMLAQTSDYEARAQEVGRLLGSRRVLNVCGEWNAHSHYAPLVRARFNQTMLGAAFGSSALLHLIRGGARPGRARERAPCTPEGHNGALCRVRPSRPSGERLPSAEARCGRRQPGGGIGLRRSGDVSGLRRGGGNQRGAVTGSSGGGIR